MRNRTFFAMLFAAGLVFSGCTVNETAEEENLSVETGTVNTESDIENTDNNISETEEADGNDMGENDDATSTDTSEMFSDRDFDIGYDEETSVQITFSGENISSTSDTVQINGNTVTITEEGTYILSGTLDNGMVAINAPDTAKIQLVLDGVQIRNDTSAAIYVAEADKVFITTTYGSENILENGGEYIAIDDNNIDSVIFSKSDLTLNGEGTLTVSAAAGHGIVSKDDLVLTSGTYVISAASQGLSGKDSVRIANGDYTITSGKDGIHAENTDDTDLGYVYISGGTFNIQAEGDGISASSALQITDGTFSIYTGEGSASVVMKTDDGGEFNRWEEEQASETQDDSVSQKGIKAEGNLTVSGGNFTTDTADDSIHSGGNIQISGGSFDLMTGDDAIHSDEAVEITDGDFIISYCYEGIEGVSVTIDSGTFNITSEDDGINAAGGADGSGFGGGGPGMDQFGSSECFITINGGEFVIVSKGDCIDSNGALTINNGTLDLTCNGNGDTAIDCDGEYINNGGSVTTNDGSEENPGAMGGGMTDGGMGDGQRDINRR